MAWYAYCITEQKAFQGENKVRRPFPIDGLKGVGGAQVFGYPIGDLAVIVSEYMKSGTLAQKAGLEHVHVISDCFKHGTVLPFKFATVFDTEEGIRQSVRANRKTFLRSVTQLRGKSEMHLKVIVPTKILPRAVNSDCEMTAVVGAEYLSRLHATATRDREEQTKARAVSQQVSRMFNALDEEITCRRDASGGLTIGIAHLIENEAVEKYQVRATAAMKQLKDCEMVVSGPWPPFHFLPEKVRTVQGHD